MLSVEELLYRHRKGNRRVVAKSLRRARKKHGAAAARELWREFSHRRGVGSLDPELMRQRGDIEADEVCIERRNGVNVYGDRAERTVIRMNWREEYGPDTD